MDAILGVADGAQSIPGGYGEFLLTTVLILALVCVLAWVGIRFGLRRLMPGAPRADRGPIRVVARVTLEPRRALYIVEAGGKTLLVGAAEHGLTALAELEPDAVAADVADAEQRGPRFADILRSLTRRAADEREPAQTADDAASRREDRAASSGAGSGEGTG